jgi:hypothetical protein
LQGSNPAKPNIMFTMDDSRSMERSTLPDYITGGLFSACRNPDASAAQCPDISPAHPPWRSKDVNHIYYDPAATYDVGVAFDKSPLPYRSGAGWTSVYTDGFAAYLGTNNATIDLTTGVGSAVASATAYRDEVFCTKATDRPGRLGDGRERRVRLPIQRRGLHRYHSRSHHDFQRHGRLQLPERRDVDMREHRDVRMRLRHASARPRQAVFTTRLQTSCSVRPATPWGGACSAARARHASRKRTTS